MTAKFASVRQPCHSCIESTSRRRGGEGWGEWGQALVRVIAKLEECVSQNVPEPFRAQELICSTWVSIKWRCRFTPQKQPLCFVSVRFHGPLLKSAKTEFLLVCIKKKKNSTAFQVRSGFGGFEKRASDSVTIVIWNLNSSCFRRYARPQRQRKGHSAAN